MAEGPTMTEPAMTETGPQKALPELHQAGPLQTILSGIPDPGQDSEGYQPSEGASCTESPRKPPLRGFTLQSRCARKVAAEMCEHSGGPNGTGRISRLSRLRGRGGCGSASASSASATIRREFQQSRRLRSKSSSEIVVKLPSGCEADGGAVAPRRLADDMAVPSRASSHRQAPAALRQVHSHGEENQKARVVQAEERGLGTHDVGSRSSRSESGEKATSPSSGGIPVATCASDPWAATELGEEEEAVWMLSKLELIFTSQG